MARLVAQIRAVLSAGVEFFVADHALLSTDPSRNIQPELPELCEHRPQVQCDRGQELKQQLLFWLTMVKVSLDYQESRSQQIGFLHGLGSATRMLLGGQ